MNDLFTKTKNRKAFDSLLARAYKLARAQDTLLEDAKKISDLGGLEFDRLCTVMWPTYKKRMMNVDHTDEQRRLRDRMRADARKTIARSDHRKKTVA